MLKLKRGRVNTVLCKNGCPTIGSITGGNVIISDGSIIMDVECIGGTYIHFLETQND